MYRCSGSHARLRLQLHAEVQNCRVVSNSLNGLLPFILPQLEAAIAVLFVSCEAALVHMLILYRAQHTLPVGSDPCTNVLPQRREPAQLIPAHFMRA